MLPAASPSNSGSSDALTGAAAALITLQQHAQRTSVIPQAVALDEPHAATTSATTLELAFDLPSAAGLDTAVLEAATPGLLAAESATAAGMAVEGAAMMLLAPYYAYASALESRPLLTKACTSCVGFVLGDLLAQHLAHHTGPEALDLLRALRLGVYGLALDGPLGSAWYDLLEAKVNPDRPTATSTVLAKTALDQLVYASIGTGLFFTTITLMEGHPASVPAVLHAKFWPTLAANYAIWPMAHLVNFRFVPSQYRLLYNNVVSIGWLALLSAITHSHGSSIFSAALNHLHLGGGHHAH